MHGEKTDNPSMRIYKNKIDNRITFKILTGYYLELNAWNYFEALKVRQLKVKVLKMCLT